MTQYIDKSKVVADLESWRDRIKIGIFSIPLTGSDKAYATFEYEIIGKIRDYLNTFEVKEVNLEKEIDQWQGYEAFPEGVEITPLPKAMEIVERTAKHFFELGLKVQKGE